MYCRLIALCLCFLCVPVQSLFAAPAEEQATVEEMANQGRLYLRKKRYKLAYQVLNRAFESPGGKQDFRTAYNRGIAAQHLLRLEVAYEMAALASKLAGKDVQRKEAVADFTDGLNRLYARLDVRPAKGETNRVGRIFVESQTGIINKKKRKVFESIQERFRATDVQLPTSIYLPHVRLSTKPMLRRLAIHR